MSCFVPVILPDAQRRLLRWLRTSDGFAAGKGKPMLVMRSGRPEFRHIFVRRRDWNVERGSVATFRSGICGEPGVLAPTAQLLLGSSASAQDGPTNTSLGSWAQPPGAGEGADPDADLLFTRALVARRWVGDSLWFVCFLPTIFSAVVHHLSLPPQSSWPCLCTYNCSSQRHWRTRRGRHSIVACRSESRIIRRARFHHRIDRDYKVEIPHNGRLREDTGSPGSACRADARVGDESRRLNRLRLLPGSGPGLPLRGRR
jgi:hypothetical protein